MEIRVRDNHCIITLLSPKVGARETARLIEECKSYLGYSVGIDLSFVNDCTIDFIEALIKMQNINLFNIPSNIFVLLNSMNLDKILNLFVSENDYLDSSHRLLNRKFAIVK